MMSQITKIMKCIVLPLFFCVSLFAQNKIAIIDTTAFADKKIGIKKLTNALNEIGFLDFIEAFQAGDLRSKIETLEKEIAVLPCDRETITTKLNKLKELKDELKITEEKLHQRYKQYEANHIEPIKIEIRGKLKEFAKQKDYPLVIDQDLIDNGVIIIDGDVDDITVAFIKFCNQEFEKEKPK